MKTSYPRSMAMLAPDPFEAEMERFLASEEIQKELAEIEQEFQDGTVETYSHAQVGEYLAKRGVVLPDHTSS
ncbi:MAG: hypothetical protein ACREN8_08725 [Candidatus Dormibacteraceae bacterium]